MTTDTATPPSWGAAAYELIEDIRSLHGDEPADACTRAFEATTSHFQYHVGLPREAAECYGYHAVMLVAVEDFGGGFLVEVNDD